MYLASFSQKGSQVLTAERLFVVFRRDRTILYSSGSLSDEPCFAHGGRVIFADPDLDEALGAALNRLDRPDAAAAELLRDEARGDLEVQLSTLTGCEQAGRAYLMVLNSRQALARGRVARLCSEFGLTGAEERLLAALAQGWSTAEAARAFGVAQTTIRTHLQRIFDKSGVRSQVALSRMLGEG